VNAFFMPITVMFCDDIALINLLYVTLRAKQEFSYPKIFENFFAKFDTCFHFFGVFSGRNFKAK
jgi:hypothetical protein